MELIMDSNESNEDPQRNKLLLRLTRKDTLN